MPKEDRPVKTNTAFSIWNDGSYPFTMNRSSFVPVELTDRVFRAKGISRYWRGNRLPNIILFPPLRVKGGGGKPVLISWSDCYRFNWKDNVSEKGAFWQTLFKCWSIHRKLEKLFPSLNTGACSGFNCYIQFCFKDRREKTKETEVTNRSKWTLAITHHLQRNLKLSRT